MLKANEKLVEKVKENMILPEGFTAEVSVWDGNYNDDQGLGFVFRKTGCKPPMEDIFDFGIVFSTEHYGVHYPDFESYIKNINEVFAKKADVWNKLEEKNKKDKEKAEAEKKAEEEKEAKKTERKRKKKA